jgi:hypothetical protein
MRQKRQSLTIRPYRLRFRAVLDNLERWAAEAMAREAADERIRERWLKRQAQEGATFASLLLDLAERRVTVTLSTTDGQRHQGLVTMVGLDFTAVRTSVGHLTVVALRAVLAVVPTGDSRFASLDGGTDDRPRPIDATMADALAEAAASRPRVSLRGGTMAVTGELRGMGSDLVVLAVGEPRPRPTYLRLGSISEISFFESG